MRDFDKEARELETALMATGRMFAENASLLQMVNGYAFDFGKYGNLIAPQTFEDVLTELMEPSVEESGPTLSSDQVVAWSKLQRWVQTDEPYFILRGYAGTGKTFLLQKLAELKKRIYYSAPTNKAAKVVGNAVGSTAKTTYSILGLRMEQQEDKMILVTAGAPPYFPRGAILVIDESSMNGKQLCEAIEKTRQRCNIKVLIVGDPMQLPPVGEKSSPAWKFTKDPMCRAMLKQQMRFDNQILTLSVALRKCIKEKDWWSPLKSDHTDTGIWKYKNADIFEQSILRAIDKLADPLDLTNLKVIAWRNKTVDAYNRMIRKHLGFKEDYCVGDIILLAEPIEEDGVLLAHTDDEFRVTGVCKSFVNVDPGVDIEVWVLEIQGDKSFTINVPVEMYDLDKILAKKSAFARCQKDPFRKPAWKDFWRTKGLFQRIRYGYALTAHRAQGSTYTGTVFVDQMDILCNPNKREAFRCLYVAVTRPTTNLHSY